jgi:hypothetical protein
VHASLSLSHVCVCVCVFVPQGDAVLLEQNIVLAGNGLGQIGHERETRLTETALRARRVDPGQVRKLGVDRHANHFAVKRMELVHMVREGGNLGRAHKRAAVSHSEREREGGMGQPRTGIQTRANTKANTRTMAHTDIQTQAGTHAHTGAWA